MTVLSGMPSATSNPDEPFVPFDPAVERANMEKQRIKELVKFRDSKTGKELAAWVRHAHAQAKGDRVTDERKWALNLGLYRGKTDLFIFNDPRYPSAHGRIGKLPQNGKYAKKINRIRPIIRTEMARLMSQQPSASVIPASSQDEDLFAAQAGEQAWQAIRERRKLDAHFAKAVFWQTITGTGFIKSYWDPAAWDKDSRMQGDIIFGAPTTFHIFVPDLMEQEIEDQPYVIHAYAKPIEWAKQRYARELDGQNLEATHSRGSQIMENSVMGVVADKKDLDSVVLYEVWIKPYGHHLLPEGGLITVVNDIVVNFVDHYPYHHGEFPYTKFEHLPTETFYADSVITDLHPLQQEYNEIRSRINETIHKMSSSQLMAPKGSIAATKITNEIGQVIYYNPGLGKPEPLPIQQIPGFVPQSLDRTLMDMEDISGQHQVSKGSAPPGVTAATAISYLQEKDDSYLVHTYQSVERGFEKIAHHSLSYAVQFWDQPRMIKTIGDDLAFDALELRGAELRSGTDVRIESGSALPESKSAKQALIMDLMSQGFIDPNKGLEMMEIGGSSRIIDQIKVDERQAQRENLKMKKLDDMIIAEYMKVWQQEMVQTDPMQVMMDAQENPEGKPSETGRLAGPPLEPPAIVPVNDWDNHEVHIEVHNRFRKSQAFESLSDSVKAQFEQHIIAHKNALVGAQMDEFMQNIPGDGTESGSTFTGEMDLPTEGDLAGDPLGLGQQQPGAQQPGAEQAPPLDNGGQTNGPIA